jgi:SHS2 domain-containing protein
MTFETFEHRADIGIRGKGRNLEEAFQETAKAMFSVEINLKNVKANKNVKIVCSAQNNEELLVEWLNALLAQSSIKNMMFSEFRVNIDEGNKGGLKLDAEAIGEKFDEKKHQPKLEIKAATYSQLKVFKDKSKRFIAQCIVDV